MNEELKQKLKAKGITSETLDLMKEFTELKKHFALRDVQIFESITSISTKRGGRSVESFKGKRFQALAKRAVGLDDIKTDWCASEDSAIKSLERLLNKTDLQPKQNLFIGMFEAV